MSRTFHSHHAVGHPETEGHTIHWAARYDLLVFLLTLGRASTLRSRTASLARIAAGESVLDVGCGTGDLALELCRRVGPTGQVAGIDASPEMIARAQGKAMRHDKTVDFRVEPIEALSFADHSFDVVVSSLVFHHLPHALKQRGLLEVRRVLKPGGRIVLVDFLRSRYRPPLHAALEEGLQDLPSLLEEAGFLQIEWQRGPFPMLGYLQGRVAD